MVKKSIIFVIESLGTGGAEISLLNLLEEFDYTKYDVYLQLLSLNTELIHLLNKNVKIIPSPEYISFLSTDSISCLKKIKNQPLKWFLTRYLFSMLLRLNKISKKEQLDKLYWQTHKKSFTTLNRKFDVAIAYTQGIPTYYVHDKIIAAKKITWMNAKYELPGNLKSYNKHFYENFNTIVTVSSFLKRYLLSSLFPEYQNKTIVIRDILNVKKIKEKSEEQLSEKIYCRPLIVTVGRYNWSKGYEFAIKAAAELKKRNIDFVWWAVGYGPLQNELQELINQFNLENNFILLGKRENPYPYIEKCDIYVQPSRNEGFGLTIAEAKILNKPMVCTSFEGHDMQIKDGENGLVATYDPEDIADKIECLINDQELYNKIKCNLKQEKAENSDEIQKLYYLINL